MISAEVLLRSLIGEPLPTTVRRRSNTVLSVESGHALVATSRSPQGRPVPVAWVQDALNRLGTGEAILTEDTSGEYRSAFLRAVLSAVPQVEIVDGAPPSVRLDPLAAVSTHVLAELERRLGMWADLLDQGGPNRVAPAVLRAAGIYGGASGVCGPTLRGLGVSAGRIVSRLGSCTRAGTTRTTFRTTLCSTTTR
jgi:hypothetical protein